MTPETYSDTAAEVNTGVSSYPVWVGWEIAEHIGQRINDLIKTEVAYVMADQNSQRHARSIQESLEKNGNSTHFSAAGENVSVRKSVSSSDAPEPSIAYNN